MTRKILVLLAAVAIFPFVLAGPSAAALSEAQIRAMVEQAYDAKVLKIYIGKDEGRNVYFVRVMYNGGNYNTAFQINTLVIDANTGKRISQFRHRSSGRSLSGSYDSRPNRQSPSSLRRGHIWR